MERTSTGAAGVRHVDRRVEVPLERRRVPSGIPEIGLRQPQRSDDGSAGSAYVGHAGQKGFKPHDSLGLASKQRGVGILRVQEHSRKKSG